MHMLDLRDEAHLDGMHLPVYDHIHICKREWPKEVALTCTTSSTSRLIKGLLVLTLAAWGFSAVAGACSCNAQLDVTLARERADAAFVGRVTELRLAPGFSEDPTISYATEDLQVILVVHSQWKGDIGDRTLVRTAFTCCLCGFTFETGEEYLVYAVFGEDGTLRTSLCTRTRRLADATHDPVVLGELKPVSNTLPIAEAETSP